MFSHTPPEQGELTHWGRVTHICVSKLTIIGSDNGLLPGRHQSIIWINAGILLIGPLGTNFSEILIEIYTFSFKKMHLQMLSGKSRPSCLGRNVLMAPRCRPPWWPGSVCIVGAEPAAASVGVPAWVRLRSCILCCMESKLWYHTAMGYVKRNVNTAVWKIGWDELFF